MKKKFSLGYLTLIIAAAAFGLTGCGTGDSTTDGAGASITDENGTDEDTTGENSTDSNDGTATDDNMTNGADSGENSSTEPESENGAADGIMTDDGENGAADNGGTADEPEGENGAADSGTIDGGTITNRAGSLFEGNDGIGMRGSENIKGNGIMY